MPAPASATPPPAKIEPWYKSGVIYELHVRAFQDSDGDGTGDFRGLTAKLDYLRNLGVTALWVLPFYPSPLKDDGYDIADYCDVHPKYGTLGDFKMFLREAHRRGLRVITELVINHTSDQHPWFQRARRARPGSRWRDYYVWSDTADKYKDTRVIFKDIETSNWTWDPVANAYYWHRFYFHQPDLNFDHPPVREEMFRVLDFWMGLGVDGVRLDAVPYLYEREGTSCENLPETHAFLKLLREHVDAKFARPHVAGRGQSVAGRRGGLFWQRKGDECHMAFHFPLMPRLFMALRMEDRIPDRGYSAADAAHPGNRAVGAVSAQPRRTDPGNGHRRGARLHVPRLRPHPPSPLNLGIRRRLAPLVGNDRKRIELLSALLFSLPGTPVIYYGDEIGMGENIYLGDRNGVRTPMQWSADKNAGFSRANPQSLYLPINLDPENHYEAVNVEVQEHNRHSLLWWMRQLIALRKRWKAFGMGSLEFLTPDNRKVLAYVRRYEEEYVLAVANLSRFVQPVELDLSSYQSRLPVELFGRTPFPPITDKPYFLTLGRTRFIGSRSNPKPRPASSPPARRSDRRPGRSSKVNRIGMRSCRRAIAGDWRPPCKAGCLRGAGLPAKPGPSSRSASWTGSRIPMELETAFLLFLQVEYIQTEPEIYAVPLACALGEKADPVCRDWPPLVLARLSVKRAGQDGVLYDAIANKNFCRALLEMISTRRHLPGHPGELEPTHTAVLRRLRAGERPGPGAGPGNAEQSNSSVIYGDRLILKLFRKLDPGVNPELEIGRFLMARRFPYAPPLAGALEYHNRPANRSPPPSSPPLCRDAKTPGNTRWTPWAGFLNGSKRCPRRTARPRPCTPCPLSNSRPPRLPRQPPNSSVPIFKTRACWANARRPCIWPWPATRTIPLSAPNPGRLMPSAPSSSPCGTWRGKISNCCSNA